MLTGILSFVSIWIVLVPITIGSIKLTSLGRDAFIIWLLAIFAAPPQILHYYLANPDSTLEKWAYNLYTCIEFFLISFLFTTKLNGKRTKLIFRATVALYCCVLCMVFVLFRNSNEGFISELVGLNNYFYTIWILLVILEQFRAGETMALHSKVPFFWFIIGLFFYAVGTMHIFILWYDLNEGSNKILKTILHSILNISMYTFFAIAIALNPDAYDKHIEKKQT